MTSLEGAIPLTQMNDTSVGVRHHLDFDMPRFLDVLLDVDIGVLECDFRLATGSLESLAKGGFVPRDSHPPAAASGHRFDQYRESNLARHNQRFLLICDHSWRTRDHRYSDLLRQFPGGSLVAQLTDILHRRPDELEITGLTDLGELRTLRKEPIPWMDGFHIGNLCGSDDLGNIKIGVRTGRGTDADFVIGKVQVPGTTIRLRVDHHRLDAEFSTRTNNPQSNLTAVGDQDSRKWFHRRSSISGEKKQGLAKLDGIPIIEKHGFDDTSSVCLDLVHHLHRFHDTEYLPFLNLIPDLDKRLCIWSR